MGTLLVKNLMALLTTTGEGELPSVTVSPELSSVLEALPI
jgi:hypothetical protein